MAIFNERLRAAYRAAGYSQTAFAGLCGVSQPAMSGFTTYTTQPTLETVRRMLRELDFAEDRPELVGYVFALVDDEVIVVGLPTVRAIIAGSLRPEIIDPKGFITLVAPATERRSHVYKHPGFKRAFDDTKT